VVGENAFGAVRMIYDLFLEHSEEVTVTNFCWSIFELDGLKRRIFEFDGWMPRIETFREIVDKFVSEQNINEFQHSPLLFSMAMMLGTLRIAHGPSDEWMEITRRLIALGADIHGFKDNGSTLTMSIIMRLADHPFDSTYVGDVWLDTLRGVGVNDSEYLEAESMHDVEYWKSQSEEPLILKCWKISEEANKFKISWDWSISPELSVFDVLNEFKHFGPTQHSGDKDYYWPENLHNWPYVYPDWKYCEDCDNAGFAPILPPWKTPQLLERTKIRFERRQRKKVFKLAKGQGLHRSPNMPGSWID
jgi:hypothetical protein